jgi:hypothetical protein
VKNAVAERHRGPGRQPQPPVALAARWPVGAQERVDHWSLDIEMPVRTIAFADPKS